jgi:signal transduction histidine kinase
VLRVVLLANMVGLNLWRLDNFVHPTLGLVVVAGLAVWTGLVIWLFRAGSRRVPWLFALDLAVALGALAVTPYLKGDGFHASVPGFWIAGALLAWAVHWWWLGGLVAATCLSATDLLVRAEVDQTDVGHVFLLMIAGPIVGYMCGSLQRMAAERGRAEREAAAASERARLARAVHDGVLQVLALVQRRGAELGGEGGELARLAGEQETALRAMIRAQDTARAPGGPVDLAGALDALSGPRVSVVTPGAAVPLPPDVAAELLAVVGECLSNVRRHVGEDAPAWVLLESLPEAVVVTVRDQGPGIPSGRLEPAAAEGRLGVASSIEGRMRDLGGTSSLVTGSFGTEWELTVPR